MKRTIDKILSPDVSRVHFLAAEISALNSAYNFLNSQIEDSNFTGRSAEEFELESIFDEEDLDTEIISIIGADAEKTLLETSSRWGADIASSDATFAEKMEKKLENLNNNSQKGKKISDIDQDSVCYNSERNDRRGDRKRLTLAAILSSAAMVLLALLVDGWQDKYANQEVVPVIRAAAGPVKTRSSEILRRDKAPSFTASPVVQETEYLQGQIATVEAPHPVARLSLEGDRGAMLSRLTEADHSTSAGDAFRASALNSPSASLPPVARNKEFFDLPSIHHPRQRQATRVASLNFNDRKGSSVEIVPLPRSRGPITTEVELLATKAPVVVGDTRKVPLPPYGAGSGFAPALSPLTRPRPSDFEERLSRVRSRSDLLRAAEASAAQIQLGAFEHRATLEAEWSRLSSENKDILSGRALVLQETMSGRFRYYRMRAGPFRDAREANSVCEALKSRGYDCLLAINTEKRG